MELNIFLFGLPYFTIDGGTCFDTDPASVPANGSCTIEVLFTPVCNTFTCETLIGTQLTVETDNEQEDLSSSIVLDLVDETFCRPAQ